MDIETIKQDRALCEAEIKSIIVSFESLSGFVVGSINISRPNFDNPREIEVEMPIYQ